MPHLLQPWRNALTPLAVTGAFFATAAAAQSLTFSPTYIIMEGNQRTSSITITNGSNSTMSYAAEFLAWTQNGQDQFVETRDFVVNPVRFTLRAGQQQTIRIGWRGGELNGERAYRLFVRELDLPSTSQGQQGPDIQASLRTLFRVGIPVFLRPEVGPAAITVALERTNDGADIVVRNTGGRYTLIRDLGVVGEGGSTSEGVSFNLLAGGVIRLPLNGLPAAVTQVDVQYFVGASDQPRRVTARLAP